MRELVAQYLSQSISRRRFVGGLTKAGLTATAAQSVLTSVTSVSYAQGAGPQPNPAPATAPAAREAATPAASTVAGVKPFQGTGGACFAEQLIACGVKYVFGNSASEDAQFYEALVDRPQLKYILTPHEGPGRRDGRGLHQGLGRAGDRDAGRGGRPRQRHRPDVQRLQGADAVGRLFLPHRPDTPRRPRRFRGSPQPGADCPADHEIYLAGAPAGHDPGDHSPRFQGGVDPALRSRLHLVAFGLQRRAGAHRDHRAGADRPTYARAAQPG